MGYVDKTINKVIEPQFGDAWGFLFDSLIEFLCSSFLLEHSLLISGIYWSKERIINEHI